MNALFRQGVRGGWCAGARAIALPRFRSWLLGVALLASGSVVPAGASVLYRCTGPQGEQAYVSHTTGYRHCVKVGHWATPHHEWVSSHKRKGQPSGTVLPGKPPRPVHANPAVVKVIPLDEDTRQVPVAPQAVPEPPQAWRPLPVAMLDALGKRVLPRLLGVQAAPAASDAPASAASVVPGATSAATPIPLQVKEPAPRPPRRGAVYRVVEKNGNVLYTNIAALAKGRHSKKLFTYIVECYACDVHSKIDWNTVPLNLADYRNDIHAAAALSGVNGALLRAVIHAESGFNPRALSYKGAQGLMQLMPATAFELGVGDAFDPAQNISGGARYLAMLLRNYHGDVRLAAAAYNAGEGAVSKYGGVPPYAETQVYVKRVALLYQRYRKALDAGGGAKLAAAKGAD